MTTAGPPFPPPNSQTDGCLPSCTQIDSVFPIIAVSGAGKQNLTIQNWAEGGAGAQGLWEPGPCFLAVSWAEGAFEKWDPGGVGGGEFRRLDRDSSRIHWD